MKFLLLSHPWFSLLTALPFAQLCCRRSLSQLLFRFASGFFGLLLSQSTQIGRCLLLHRIDVRERLIRLLSNDRIEAMMQQPLEADRSVLLVFCSRLPGWRLTWKCQSFRTLARDVSVCAACTAEYRSDAGSHRVEASGRNPWAHLLSKRFLVMLMARFALRLYVIFFSHTKALDGCELQAEFLL